MDLILDGLNSAQAQAMEILNGPVLILAGAVSGKTNTLTHRISNHGARALILGRDLRKPSN